MGYIREKENNTYKTLYEKYLERKSIGFQEVEVIDGIFYSKDMTHIIRCPVDSQLKEIKIPDSVKVIDYQAFQNCEALESVSIPNSVENIFGSAFSECHNLKNVEFGSGMAQLGQYSKYIFYDCSSLEEIEIPGTSAGVGVSAFHACKNLKHVKLNEGTEFIDDRAFYNCQNLKTLVLPKSFKWFGNKAIPFVEQLDVADFGVENIPNALFNYDRNVKPYCTVRLCGEEYYVPHISKNQRTIADMNDVFQYGYYGDIQYICDNWYKNAKYIPDKQDIALAAYYRYQTVGLEKYLKKAGKNIACRFLEDSREKDFLQFAKLGFLSPAAKKDLLETARKKNLTESTAWLINNSETKDLARGFSL